MKWTEEYVINNHDTDYNCVVSLTGIMRYIQDTAYAQMNGQGPTYNELISEGKSFVLSKLNISLYRPLYGRDKIEAATWAVESTGVSFGRCYSIKKDGVLVAEATSVWALLDTKVGRLIRVRDFENNYAMDEMPELDASAPLRLSEDFKMPIVGEHTVEYRDCDVNRHMNNTVYGDLFCGYIPMDKKRVISFRINYKAEAPLGKTMRIYMKETEEDTYLFRASVDGKITTEAEIITERI